MARYLDIHPQDPQPRLLAQAAQVIADGGLIAYPTDSGYALGCALGNQEGKERIASIRRLDDRHHYTLICSSFAQLGHFVLIDNAVFRAIKAATPGPFTFILPATKEVPRRLMHPKKKTVGVRLPDHRLITALLAEVGEPLLSSTLILPGHEEPLTEGWVVGDEIGHLVDAIIEGECGLEPTTVVDLSSRVPVIIRQGAGDARLFVDEE